MAEKLEILNEIWKFIPGYDSYEVSNLGRVKSYKGKNPKILKPGNTEGYNFVSPVNNEGKTITKGIHQLVALAFIGPNPDNLDVCHIDDNKLNNSPSNLKYETRAKNIQEYHCKNKSETQLIKTMYATGKYTLKEIGKVFGLSESGICRIIKGNRRTG